MHPSACAAATVAAAALSAAPPAPSKVSPMERDKKSRSPLRRDLCNRGPLVPVAAISASHGGKLGTAEREHGTGWLPGTSAWRHGCARVSGRGGGRRVSGGRQGRRAGNRVNQAHVRGTRLLEAANPTARRARDALRAPLCPVTVPQAAVLLPPPPPPPGRGQGEEAVCCACALGRGKKMAARLSSDLQGDGARARHKPRDGLVN
ncbi:uncharacterized protein VTP21DRAFT_345 [Calcarisporiella thermophila]|uniref:uncharacterized protein n=1 Tax=Calcarisporiella thermophila TaxID=911321 RepID=UPI00374263D1